MKHDLNDRFLRSRQPPLRGRTEISDTRRPGLRFRLTAAGKATWIFEKRVKGGTKRKITMGSWPALSLADARGEALKLAAEFESGIDRVAEERAAKLAEEARQSAMTTVKDTIEVYYGLHLRHLRTGDERKRQLLTSLEVHLGLPICELSRHQMQNIIDEKAAGGRKVMANRLKAAFSAFTRWAWQRGYTETDAGAALTRSSAETARERVLTVEEVRAIFRASQDLGPLWGPIFRMLLLTGQRRAEILNLRWEEIDLTAATITKPGSATKNGKPHITHLSEPARLELAAMTDREGLVFTTTGITPVSGVTKAKRRIDDLLGDDFEAWRIHDFRTALATHLAHAGEPEGVVDRILNHSASGSAPSAVARVYNQANMLPQRARALDRWADIVTEAEGSVVMLNADR